MNQRNTRQGLFFLIIAALLLGRAFNIFVLTSSVFKIVLSALLVSFALSSLGKGKYVETMVPLAFVYILNEKELMNLFPNLNEVNSWLLIWGSLFLGIALDSMFKKKRSKYFYENTYTYNSDSYNSDFEKKTKSNGFVDVEFSDSEDNTQSFESKKQDFEDNSYRESVEDDYVKIESNLGDRTRYIRVDNFTNGDIEMNLGSLRVYFDQSTFNPNGSKLNVDCNFGKLTLYIPSNVRVVNNVTAMFGAVHDLPQSTASDPKLVIEGSVSFGNLRIIYI